MRRWLTIVLGISYVCVITGGLTVGLLALSGCGKGDSGGNGDRSAEVDGTEPSGDGDGTVVAGKGPRIDADGRKWLEEDFPYDVWYTSPYDVAKQQGTVAASPTGDSGTTPETGSPKPADPPPAAGGGDLNWKDVVAGSVLDDEVTKINNRFRAKLQTLATYNSSFLELEPHMATLAALSGIAAQHPDDIRWKKNAKQIRDLSAKMLSEKLKSGAKAYRQVNEPYLAIADILSGSPPGGLPEPNENDSLSEYADMGLLMKRFDVAGKWLQVNVGTENALKENADDVKREVGVLAALATGMTTEGYGFVDDDEFKGFVKELVDHCKKMAEAASTGNFQNYEVAASQLNQSCDKCHSSYR